MLQTKHVFYAVLISLIWGINFSISKLGLNELPPFLFAGLRFFMTAIPLLFICKKPNIPYSLLVGIGFSQGVFAFGFCFYSMLNGLPIGLLSLIYQTHILFTVVLAYFLFKNVPNKNQIIGLTIATVGIIAIIKCISDVNTTITTESLIGVFLAALFWALGSVLTKKAGKVDSLSLIVWTSIFAAIANFVISYYLEGPELIIQSFNNMTWHSVLILSYAVIAATLIGASLQAYLFKIYSPTQISPYFLLVPITGLISGWIIFDEQINFYTFLSCCIVFIGLAINQLPIRQLSKKTTIETHSIKRVA